MKVALLRHVLGRALILSLAVPALAEQAACGGDVILDQQASPGNGGAGGSGSGGSSNVGTVGVGGGSTAVVGVGGGNTESCSLTSTMPIDIVNGGCQEDFGLAGPASICSPGQGGMLNPSQCGMLCPPNSNGESAFACEVQDLSAPPDSGVVTCFFSDCGTGG